jgi:hypothetical protein
MAKRIITTDFTDYTDFVPHAKAQSRKVKIGKRHEAGQQESAKSPAGSG